jgi:aldehyde dehydrogenase (NAD+)
MAKLVVDNALKDGTQIGPVVDQDQLDIDLSYIDIGRKEGARVAAGGERLKRDHDGFYLAPTLFVDATPDMRISREEIFGPVAAVMRVKDYDEALAVANDTNFGLSSGICTTSLKHAEHFKANSQTGVVKVNLSTSGVDFHLPFGGRKASSYGAREQGAHVRDFFTTLKTAYQLAL